jgi:D-alanyl-D-alanine carboxypeptidase/D-alanyl-D-alanine-endopeptidase (penicillin-binding protein 4)
MHTVFHSTIGKYQNHIFSILITTAIIYFSSCASQKQFAKTTQLDESLKELAINIDDILQDSSLQQTRTGLKIVSLETGQIMYSRNSQQLFHPASNMKMLTTATALKRLGPNFKFETVLYCDTGAVSDSVISGNLYLKGYGNPDLTTDDLRRIVHDLKSIGIRYIRGNLICDESYFDDLHLGNGWMWDDASDWYWAPISALTANDNCVGITVKPGNRIGQPLLVTLEPATAYMKIENRGTTLAPGDTLNRKLFKVKRKWKKPENTIVIEGGLTINESPKSFDIDVMGAALYTGTLFAELLQDQNIILDGNIEEGVVPDTNTVLVQHKSAPLSWAVFNTNKISDNLSAECILKTIGAEEKGVPGTAEKGISAIYQYLAEIGVDSSTYKLADGSGVSRYNIITPDLIINLLEDMHSDFSIQAEFKNSLPIAGIDGTIENRMKDSAAEGKLRAKTGSLSGVSTLSGYTTTADNELLAFSIIMEHFVVPTNQIRSIQDTIGALISSFSRKQ